MGHTLIYHVKHVIFESRENIYFSTYPSQTLIRMSHHLTSASKSIAQKSFDCCLPHFCTWSGIVCDFRTYLKEFLDPIVNSYTRQTLPSTNGKHFYMNILCIGSFCQKKKRTTERCSTIVDSSSTFAILTTETSL
jgi:hypothetical protein